jgi:hypothetical protein
VNAEMIGQPLGNAGNADVPGDVALELARGYAEIAERVRNDPAIVIAGEKEGRIAVRITFMHRRNIAMRQKVCCGTGVIHDVFSSIVPTESAIRSGNEQPSL